MGQGSTISFCRVFSGKVSFVLVGYGLGKRLFGLVGCGGWTDQLIVWGVGWGPTVLSCGVWNGDRLCDLGGWRRAN